MKVLIRGRVQFVKGGDALIGQTERHFPYKGDGRGLFMMIRFAFNYRKSAIKLLKKNRPDHLMRESHPGKRNE